MRTRVHPKISIKSTNITPPKGLQIDLYNPKWFNTLSTLEKQTIADSGNVAFLPNPEDSLQGKGHPNEKISDKCFNKKHCETVIGEYDLQESKEDSEDDRDSDDIQDGSIHLEETSENEDDEDNGLLEPGEYSYKDKAEVVHEDGGSGGEGEEEIENNNEGMEGVQEDI
ncbi:hypothetical protein O181_074428 [Austropuccinia psidii MF-1]|uniref:Uncharacterized protein n=1 Tax=Austropuccinia psidii MF-1 TaxID=1389203 RepID=A0A9Q3IAY7_9BASI|nr:hypothetical protein [Austropuccinia psidii MF-1]